MGTFPQSPSTRHKMCCSFRSLPSADQAVAAGGTSSDRIMSTPSLNTPTTHHPQTTAACPAGQNDGDTLPALAVTRKHTETWPRSVYAFCCALRRALFRSCLALLRPVHIHPGTLCCAKPSPRERNYAQHVATTKSLHGNKTPRDRPLYFTHTPACLPTCMSTNGKAGKRNNTRIYYYGGP